MRKEISNNWQQWERLKKKYPEKTEIKHAQSMESEQI